LGPWLPKIISEKRPGLKGNSRAPRQQQSAKVGTVSRIQALSTALYNGQNPLGTSNTNAMKQLRGPKHENWPVCDPRATPPEEYGLKSGENGYLARANGAIDGPHCSPTWPSVFGRRCGAGWSGWWVWGVELHQRPHAARGALLQFECLSKTRGAQTVRARRGRRLCAGCLG
jgi:hypothetical protein